MLRVVGEVEPRFVFAENVARGPIDTAANDCRGRGFSTAMGMFCASGVGCPARRPRWWLVAYADGKGESRCPVDAEVAGIHPVAGLDWWQDDPRALGVVDGVADRMDRLAALGNGQVPSVAARAFTTLAKHLTKELAS
jgi:DNA (cytosine-5)-methyltransferase 1